MFVNSQETVSDVKQQKTNGKTIRPPPKVLYHAKNARVRVKTDGLLTTYITTLTTI